MGATDPTGGRGSDPVLWLFTLPLPIETMELNGALLNRDVRENLGRGTELVQRLGQLPAVEAAKWPALARRSGLVRNAVLQVLAASKHPLRAREIHAAAERLVGEPLSWNTVKDCLHKSARRPDSPIDRVGRGRYRHL